MTVKPPAIRQATPTKQAAEKQLRQAMAAALERGGYIPCRSNPDLWHADSLKDRDRAASMCQGCPVLADCGEFAHASPPAVWGVWAGLDMTAKTRRARTDRFCERCGAEYSPTHKDQLYCTTDCSAQAHREQRRAYARRRAMA